MPSQFTKRTTDGRDLTTTDLLAGASPLTTVASVSYERDGISSKNPQVTHINQMIFSGTSGFSLQKRLADHLDQPRNTCKEQTNHLAKMNFNINMEKAKRSDLIKDIEEREITEAKKRKQDAEDNKRKSDLSEATTFNNQMHDQLRNKILMDRQLFLQEKDNIQTSLKSKVVEDAQENFKFNQRKQRHIDANHHNKDNKYM